MNESWKQFERPNKTVTPGGRVVKKRKRRTKLEMQLFRAQQRERHTQNSSNQQRDLRERIIHADTVEDVDRNNQFEASASGPSVGAENDDDEVEEDDADEDESEDGASQEGIDVAGGEIHAGAQEAEVEGSHEGSDGDESGVQMDTQSRTEDVTNSDEVSHNVRSGVGIEQETSWNK
jgi:hypothetical protein